ncbi:proline dehydrogenase family protein [Sunxiuqinia elliptica]|uniref:proline dehydrogenase n=1 Tax=Sunxiuqinia elliptica TaxID=655355 RepID=A0A4R6HAX5_9BACT|nr:proline dehydrogenase family protein [Sunxiuqinia elliptica]TDO04871.1 L-proline dehydrogenase [Sunxiuqinia elliptica]TDO64419.1 L-proline dehydrogenase [Sunxiuqinia elliptica]
MFNKMLANLLPYMPKKLIWLFSKRYIAGEGIDQGLEVSKKLNEKNIEVTIDLLGEFITSLEQAEENKNQYLEIIERFTAEGIQGNFSLKPTMFGLLIDQEVCYQHIREIIAKAAEKNNFIRIDMEDSQCVDIEIELFKKLKKEFSGHVGLVIQAYLRRTLEDLTDFSNFPSNGYPLNFRLCKGIYVEPKQIAFKDYEEVRKHYLEDLEFMFQNKMYAGIATHDKFLVEEALKLIEKYQVPQTMYEFQMLYGVTPELRSSIVNRGHKMRVYVPFGKQWFNYSTRRLKENPKMASHIIKALFFRG